VLKKLCATGVVAAATTGVMLLGAPAHADPVVTDANGSIGSGNQLINTIQVPISVCGNAVSIVGNSLAGCEGNATAISKRG
jgi:hypothetical protein